MHTLGIIGGVACGKSTVARAFQRLGAVVLNADAAGHAVLTEPEVITQLVARWGPTILTENGEIDRPSVARIVFAPEGEAERKFLEAVSHPRIQRRLEAQIAAEKQADTPAVVIDAALLIEAGWDETCDSLIFVDAPREQRLARAHSRGWSDEEFARREAVQLSVDYKRGRATHVIDNTGPEDALISQVARIWERVTNKIAGN